MCADSTGSPINCFNFGNPWRQLTLPAGIADWSLASLQLHLVKAGGRLIEHARYYWLMLADGHFPFLRLKRWLFRRKGTFGPALYPKIGIIVWNLGRKKRFRLTEQNLNPVMRNDDDEESRSANRAYWYCPVAVVRSTA
jgi:hypothetical protein